jgi:hypothetical protein
MIMSGMRGRSGIPRDGVTFSRWAMTMRWIGWCHSVRVIVGPARIERAPAP